MAGKPRRAPLMLSDSHRSMLVERAKVLLEYVADMSLSDIERQVGVSRPTIYKCIDKAIAAGVLVGLKDAFHRPKEPEITEAAKSWHRRRTSRLAS